MITPGQLRRITLDGLPEAVMLKRGAILFRHYEISVHALDRFTQRCDLPAFDILSMLHDAVVAFPNNIKHIGVRRVVEKHESRGGYVLANGECYFIVMPDAERGQHVVTTVMTQDCTRYRARPTAAAKRYQSEVCI